MEYELIEDDEQDQYPVAPFMSYARRRAPEFAERDPIVGDIVHWWSGEKCRAAMVLDDYFTGVPEGSVPPPTYLRVFVPGDHSPEVFCDHDEAKGESTWHWPCGGQ